MGPSGSHTDVHGTPVRDIHTGAQPFFYNDFFMKFLFGRELFMAILFEQSHTCLLVYSMNGHIERLHGLREHPEFMLVNYVPLAGNGSESKPFASRY